MDKISGLSDDEFLVKILSLLPTKTAVSTSVLSKHWKYLWKRVSKLEYDDTDNITKPSKSQTRFRRFVQKNLPIERESDLESLHLKFTTKPFQPQDIKSWVEIAVSRGIRDLSIAYSSDPYHSATLPYSLYTCKSLVTLKLEHKIFLNIPFPCTNHTVWFPCLKTLQLRSVTFFYYEEDPIQGFLSKCPVLKNLIVEGDDYLRKFSVPSLQRLSLELEEAYIDVIFRDVNKFLQPIASVKRLSLCLTVKKAKVNHLDSAIVLDHLEHLKLCTCNKYWSKLLVRFLQDSPKLRVLELYLNEHHSDCSKPPMGSWKNHYVPQFSATSLETFKWIGCEGRRKERDVVAYILNNAPSLKTATIFLTESRTLHPQKKHEMINGLMTLTSTASTTCKLVFN